MLEIARFLASGPRTKAVTRTKEETKNFEAFFTGRQKRDTKIGGGQGCIAGLTRVGSFGHHDMGRSLPHDIVGTILDSLISPPAHTPITPSTTSRQLSPKGVSFLLLAQRCIPNFRTSFPTSFLSSIINPRHSIFRPGILEASQPPRDTRKSCHDGHVCCRQTCPISLCLSLAVRPPLSQPVLSSLLTRK
jgi:hypothetical protein